MVAYLPSACSHNSEAVSTAMANRPLPRIYSTLTRYGLVGFSGFYFKFPPVSIILVFVASG